MSADHPTKRCPRCDTVKPLSAFSRSSASKNGAASYCKPCARAFAADNYARKHIPLPGLKALARAADAADRKAAKTRAVRRRATDEYKAAAKVLAPALAALKAAVAALEALMGPPAPTRLKRQPADRRVVAPSDGPPSIREIKTIMAEEGVTFPQARRIQEREIATRADWQSSIRAG